MLCKRLRPAECGVEVVAVVERLGGGVERWHWELTKKKARKKRNWTTELVLWALQETNEERKPSVD